MAPFITILGSGKGTWSTVSKLINMADWDKVIIITNSFGKENFPKRFPSLKNYELIVVNEEKSISELVKELMDKLKPLLSHDFDIALNLESGSGKIHMALISSLMNLGISFRPISIENNELKELNIYLTE